MMTPEEIAEMHRLQAKYVTPALDALYDRVMQGEPLTYVEIGLWNMAAGPELQIQATQARKA